MNGDAGRWAPAHRLGGLVLLGALAGGACGAGVRRDPTAGRPVGDGGAADDGGSVGDTGSPDTGPAEANAGIWQPCGKLGSGEATGMALSPNGGTVAVAYRNGQLTAHRTEDGAVVADLRFSSIEPPPSSGAPSVALSSDASLVALTFMRPTGDSFLAVRRIAGGETIFEIPGRFEQVQFSPDDTRLAALDLLELVVIVWRLDDGGVDRRYGVEAVDRFVFAADGSLITFDRMGKLDREVMGSEFRLAGFQTRWQFSPRGSYVASWFNQALNGSVVQLNRPDGMFIGSHVAMEAIGEVTFATDDSVVAIRNARDQVTAMYTLPVKTAIAVAPSFPAAAAALEGMPATSELAIGPGGSLFLRLDSAGVLAWEAAAPGSVRVIPTLPGSRGAIRSLAASPDGRFLATAAERGVSLWDLRDRRHLWTRPLTSAGVAFFPDGSRVLTSAAWIQEWPVDGSDAPMVEPRCVSGWHASYSADGARIALTLPWGFLLMNGSEDPDLGPVFSPSEAYPAVAFSPDGQFLATSEPALWRASEMTRVWPATESASVTSACDLPPPTDGAEKSNWVAFSPDGRLIAVTRSERTSGGVASTPQTKIYRAEDGSVHRDLGRDVPRRPVFSEDGAWLAAGSLVMEIGADTSRSLAADGVVSTFAAAGTVAIGHANGTVSLHCAPQIP
jgi:WD40 repeat protein